MIHRMAAVQSIACERSRSAQVNLVRLFNNAASPERYSQLLRQNFDAVVVTMSNVLRRGESDGAALEAIRHIDIPLYVVGMGMQGALPGGLSELSSDMQELVQLISSKAKLLGVRGHRTRKWLLDAGIPNAEAIGCPSMFAYPLNIIKLSAPKGTDRIMVAGHLDRKKVEKQSERAAGLMRAFERRRCSYVFQDEISSYHDLVDGPGMYDEATSRVNASAVREYLKQLGGIEPPFEHYYSFNEAAAWRQAATKYDLYIGDRIHGGVAAMQAGVPALVLYDDARVAELTSYHGIPSCSVKRFVEMGVDRAVKEYLNENAITAFKVRYIETLTKYASTMASKGLALANHGEVAMVLKMQSTR